MPATYQLQVGDLAPVFVTKKRGMKSIRMRIASDGSCRVSAPWYVGQAPIKRFIEERQEWIKQHTSEPSELRDGMELAIGITLRISYGAQRNSARLKGSLLTLSLKNEQQQAYIQKTVVTYMMTAAEHVMLPKLNALAERTGHDFHQAYVKRLSSRWGSCDSQKNIILNVYLVQLPSDLQEYVMAHELAHTRFMNHSQAFWNHVGSICPDYKERRKRLRAHSPKIYEAKTLMA